MKRDVKAKYRRYRERAFTTVEMWTAAAIAVVLLGCAGYAYLSSLRNASKSACLTHLHTIHTALVSYATDNDGNLPPYAFGPISGQPAHQTEFIQCLVGLGLTNATWFCPSDSHAHTRFKGNWTDFSVTSYGMPPSLVAKGKEVGSSSYVLNMPGDTSTVLVCDQPFGRGSTAHGKLANAVFGDGHVALTSVSRL